jgi:hypothetical protein
MAKAPIKQVIKDENSPTIHPFISEERELVSIGYARASDGSNSYVSYTIVSKGDKIISITVGEPNMKLIVQDEAKINFVTNFLDK